MFVYLLGLCWFLGSGLLPLSQGEDAVVSCTFVKEACEINGRVRKEVNGQGFQEWQVGYWVARLWFRLRNHLDLQQNFCSFDCAESNAPSF